MCGISWFQITKISKKRDFSHFRNRSQMDSGIVGDRSWAFGDTPWAFLNRFWENYFFIKNHHFGSPSGVTSNGSGPQLETGLGTQYNLIYSNIHPFIS